MKVFYSDVSDSLIDVKEAKRDEVYNFGKDNAFPSLVEALISVSVTSKTCVDRVARSIYGKGFSKHGEIIVNKKGQSLNEVLRIAARQYAKHNNVYIHVGYDANLEIKSIVVVDATDVRVGKSDDRGYSGKFIVYDNWDKSKQRKIVQDNFKTYYRYNPDKEVIKGQIVNDAKKRLGKRFEGGNIEDLIQYYSGQILHIKKDESYIYSLPDLNPVLSEALLESNSQTFRSRGSTHGFLNAKMMTVQPFADDDSRDDFKNAIENIRGAEGSGSVLVVETTQMSDDVSKQVKLEDLSGAFNDKIFEYSDKQAERNICKAFTVPLILVTQEDNSMFGGSGELLEEAKNQLWESREEDRIQMEETFGSLMRKFQGGIGDKDLVVLNPFFDSDEAKEAKNINKKAQATLRGSVGGVTAIVQLVQEVKAGTIDIENAVAIIKNIYGFSESKAREMVGDVNEM